MSVTESLFAEGELPSMEQLLEEKSFAPLRRGDIRRGEVIDIWPSYVVMDLRAKREGFVPQRDLARLDEEERERVAVGAEFPVYVLRTEDYEGRAIVSISRGLVQNDWDRARAFLESRELWESQVTGYNKGGLLVQFGRLRGFIPASHVVGFPRSLPFEEKQERLAEWVGREVGLRLIEVNQRRNRLVLSERAAQREWREQRMQKLLEDLQVGQVVSGRVSSLQDFGAFVDLGGVDGLIHISELAWKRVDHPREVVQVGGEVEVRVIRLDRQRNRISLSLREAGENPWDRIEERYSLGQLVDGQVTRIVSYGAFARLEEGIEGLIHISELSVERVDHPRDVLEEGETLPLRVVRVDPVRRRLGLSFRRVTTEEWEEWRSRRLSAAQLPAEGTEVDEEGSPGEPEGEAVAERPADEAASGGTEATEEKTAAERPAAEVGSAGTEQGQEGSPGEPEGEAVEERPGSSGASVEPDPPEIETETQGSSEEVVDGQEEGEEIQAENPSGGQEAVSGDRAGQNPAHEGASQSLAPEESPPGQAGIPRDAAGVAR